MMSIFKEPISEAVWDMKYRYRQQDQIIDQSIDDTWLRVAKAIASVEKNKEQAHFQNAFYDILKDFRFLPGGRILAGAGTAHHVTLFNCFVMHIDEDSLKGIFDALLEGALTLQQGGGVGYDFSRLRPRGTLVKSTGIPASGPVSFMRIWDTTCKILLSTGARRGAMMGVLRVDHPDIEEFIEAKKDPQELRHFNVSVMVTDEFMHAVKNNTDWPLVFPSKETEGKDIIHRQWSDAKAIVPCRIYRTVKARPLWDKIIHSAYLFAEPGVLFSDTINRLNNLWYREQIAATNPCGEIPLPPYGACNLGAINLTQFIQSPFSKHASLDWNGIEKTIAIATRFQDNIIDLSRYPLEKQAAEAKNTRRIGIGLTGLADAFVMLNIRYGDPESIHLAAKIMKKIAEITWLTSIELAEERGAFPLFDKKYLQGEFVKTLDESIQIPLQKYGVRNSHHNTIAPTGTISLLANNISNGIEPIYQASYKRHMRMQDDQIKTYTVMDDAYRKWQSQDKTSYPSAWIEVDQLKPSAHLDMQAAMQKFIDNAISKTINIPKDFPFEELIDVYTKSHELGLKGCTIFRPNPVTGRVLESSQEEEKIDRCCSNE